MFTGIVKAVAPISFCEKQANILTYAVRFPSELLVQLECGASVSVDGVCQTVVNIQNADVFFEAIAETVARTTFSQMYLGRFVNLERSAKFGEEIGGHLLSGHIYGTASILNIQNNIYTFQCTKAWTKYLFSKGYIAVDGISLTLVDVDRKNGLFSLHLIPETLKRTALGQKKTKELVNLEFDALTIAAVETIEAIERQEKVCVDLKSNLEE